MKRVVSLWLPTFATDRLTRHWTSARRSDIAVATVTAVRGSRCIVAVNAAATAAGITPGLTLAAARALRPALAVAEATPAADRGMLATLADGCGRYTPWTAVDDSVDIGASGGGAGLWLNISGCTHLFGGERNLLVDLLARVRGLGFAAAAAVADTPGAAWAVARCAGGNGTVIAPGESAGALAALPVAALRLPAQMVSAFERLGLYRIGDIAVLPRAPLAARFGTLVTTRLDQAHGRLDEPISPRLPLPAFAARLAFAEPIADADAIRSATTSLLAELCARLQAARQGVRRLELRLFRTDGSLVRTAIGTSRPVRDPDHLERLLREKLDRLDPGLGVDLAVLAATVVTPLAPAQMRLDAGTSGGDASLARLVDRLGNRLAPGNVVRLTAAASHVPERACRPRSALNGESDGIDSVAGDAGDQRSRQPRPLLLMPAPEPIDVVAPVPDGPPALFRRGCRQHRVAAAEGPERIGPDWWREDGGHHPERLARIRDYYRVEDTDGCRFWIYREGLYRPDVPPRWYLHGLFA